MTFTIPFALACVWLVLANILAIIPSNDHHWRRAYMLMTVGGPLLVWLFIANGPLMALTFLGAGMWILRWPVIYLGRWMRRQVSR